MGQNERTGICQTGVETGLQYEDQPNEPPILPLAAFCGPPFHAGEFPPKGRIGGFLTHMKWINIETHSLRMPEYVGSDPIQRATWFNLLAYCCEQENGGTIKNCRDWGDRRWMQTCGITKAEAELKAELWEWLDDSLTVWNYPSNKEAEVRAKREAGAKGGRASKPPKRKGIKAVLEAELEAERKQSANGKERKGKEGNGNKEKKSRCSEDEFADYARERGKPESDGRYMFDHFESNGWKRGKEPIRDWKAAFRTWEAQGFLPSQKSGQTGTPDRPKEGTMRDGMMFAAGQWRKVQRA